MSSSCSNSPSRARACPSQPVPPCPPCPGVVLRSPHRSALSAAYLRTRLDGSLTGWIPGSVRCGDGDASGSPASLLWTLRHCLLLRHQPSVSAVELVIPNCLKARLVVEPPSRPYTTRFFPDPRFLAVWSGQGFPLAWSTCCSRDPYPQRTHLCRPPEEPTLGPALVLVKQLQRTPSFIARAAALRTAICSGVSQNLGAPDAVITAWPGRSSALKRPPCSVTTVPRSRSPGSPISVRLALSRPPKLVQWYPRQGIPGPRDPGTEQTARKRPLAAQEALCPSSPSCAGDTRAHSPALDLPTGSRSACRGSRCLIRSCSRPCSPRLSPKRPLTMSTIGDDPRPNGAGSL